MQRWFRDLLITSGVRNDAITENIVTDSEGGFIIDAQTAAESGVTPRTLFLPRMQSCRGQFKDLL